MDIFKYKKLIYALFGIIAIIMLLFLIYGLSESRNDIPSREDANIRDTNIDSFQRTAFVSSRILFLPLTGFFGMLAGAIIFYLMSSKINRTEQLQKKNTKIILNFLNSHERSVIERLIENNGSSYQYEINHIKGLNRVKTHRILKNLENNGIIKRETYGKINRITLNKDLYDVLKDN